MKKEPLEISCKSILLILKELDINETDSSLIELIQLDLLGKFIQLPSGALKNKIAKDMLKDKISPHQEPYFNYITGDAKMHTKKHFDILIFTVVPNEFKAVKKFLNLEGDTKELSVHGFRFWETEITSKRNGKQLTCLVSMIGEATNVYSAVAATTALSKYQFNLAILVGIAAGAPGTGFADVIIGDAIIDYESKRIEATKEKNRPHFSAIDETLRKQASYFETDFSDDFSKFFKSAESELFDDIYQDCKPKIKRAPILAGDKLLADGVTVPKLIDEYHEKAKAVEMESNGFTLACKNYQVPWMVFRGISDFGDPAKPDLKKFQQNAALSAILACKLFLEESYDNFNANDTVSYAEIDDEF